MGHYRADDNDDGEEEGIFLNDWRGNVDEERDSLLREAADHSALASRQALRFRAARPTRTKRAHRKDNNTILGFVRSGIGSRYLCHSIACMAILATVAILYPSIVLFEENPWPDDYSVEPPHQPSYGGGLNPGHNNNHTSSFGLHETEEFPVSNVGVAVVSATATNRQNWNGHYQHDPYQSPYASLLYQYNVDHPAARAAAQARFDASRLAVLQEYGGWFHTTDPTLTSPAQWDENPHRDKPWEDFPETAWQLDEAYVKRWLPEALGLVQRVKEGIYREYGYQRVVEEGRPEKQQVFGVILGNYTVLDGTAYKRKTSSPSSKDKLPGIAYLTTAAWNGLVRKLLHAVMTHDDFYAVVVGPGGATYRGHNFAETQIMQFNHIMEPVLDKLGVRLISRNMGMAASTTIAALGGADIYGEADILWYISDPTAAQPESLGQFDLLHKQAILSGERMPLILTPNQARLSTDTSGRAWIGNIQPGTEVCKPTKLKTIPTPFVKLPKVEACQYLRCNEKAARKGICDKYRSKCWVPRSDWNPAADGTPQSDDAGFQASGYANYQQHRWEARKLAMLVLHALEEALKQWTQKTEDGVFPLPEEMWHVGGVYEELRESVRTLVRQPGKSAAVPFCEKLLEKIDPMICHMSMHAYTEWTPRVNPMFNRIKNITESELADPSKNLIELYENVDLRPLQWEVPNNTVDVHMIAIATNLSVNENKTISDAFPHNFGDGDDDDDVLGDDDVFGPDPGDDPPRRARNLGTSRTDQEIPQQRMDVSRSLFNADASASKWAIYKAPIGFCDGSAQSRCNRALGNTCLVANYNHFKAGVLGRGDGGWLHLTLRNFKEGIVLVRFDWDITPISRLPEDFELEFSFDGVKHSMSRATFVKTGVTLASDLIVHPLMIDKGWSHNDSKSGEVKVGMRIRSPSTPEQSKLLLTHVYYA